MTAACGKTVPNEFGYGDPVKPLSVEERIQIAARNAAVEARQGRIVAGALTTSEQIYRKSPKSPDAAYDYAVNLRKAGMPEQAHMVLRPFAIDPRKSNVDILVEYAKEKLQLGDFEGAQIYAEEAMVLNDNYAPAHHVLGIAVDAQGHHQAAENHFKKALQLMNETDPLHAAVNNNLALSLMAQGKDAEAQIVLSQAHPANPTDAEISEGNSQLLNAL